MEKFRNYVGQLRLYSLADLVLLLVAIGANQRFFIGAIILHIAFLAYLENGHSHPYRAEVKRWIAYSLAVIGLVAYGRFEGLAYLFFGFLYTQKIKNFGLISPISRGLQNLFIVAGILGYHSPITYIVGGLLVLRNLAGDFRDVEKDKREGVRTIPVMIGVTKDIKYTHLIFTVLTSIVWWSFSSISIMWLLLVIIIQVSTYNLTPR